MKLSPANFAAPANPPGAGITAVANAGLPGIVAPPVPVPTVVPGTMTSSVRGGSAPPSPLRSQTVAAGKPLSPLPTSKNAVRAKAKEEGIGTEDEEVDVDPEVLDVYNRIDTKLEGSFSKLDFFAAMQRDATVNRFVLPGFDSSRLLSDERSYDAVDAVFEAMAGGKQRIDVLDLAAHIRKVRAEKTPKTKEIRTIFNRIDADGSGSISKLEFVAAMQQDAEVDEFVLPGVDSSQVMNDEWSFNAVDAAFEAIAGGKKRIEYSDFERYFHTTIACASPVARAVSDRTMRRIFIIGPGFGREMNPYQGRLIEEAGFQVHWCSTIPNPEQPNFPVSMYLGQITAEIDWFQPDLVACASKGGVYIVALWQMGFWRGPTVLINAHPSCKRLPEGVPVVLAHGANDEVYPTSRADLERLISTGSENMCFLYYTANSGQVSPGMLTRGGDAHNMESLLHHDCLPRLIDAALCPEGPEVHMVRTWRTQRSFERLEAERWLGYRPERLRERWASRGRRGRDEQQLFEVPPTSEEFHQVARVFKAMPRDTAAYLLAPPEVWQRVQVLRVERVENGLQEEGSFRPYYDALHRSFADQGIECEPGVHTCWAFHGADASATESIITNPVAGFQPLASGSRNAALWGSGTYFARDANYVADSHFCGQPAADGSRQMLMCLLMIGMPCMGDPHHRGVLPFRCKPHRYNSSVDSLSSPEIYIVQHPGAAYPAYLVTFR